MPRIANIAALPDQTCTGWMLFDGDCGICRKLVARGKALIVKRDLLAVPLQTPWVADAYQLSETELLRDVRLVFADGNHLQGADVYRYVARKTWWLWPLWLISVIPGFSHLVNFAYRKFADNRSRFSSTCSLQ